MTLTVAPERAHDLTDVTDALAHDTDLALMTADGRRVALPAELRTVLTAAAQSLSQGQEILLATKDSYLTAQEAADYLGVSRPTMIRILDLGEVPYERPNSHRRIKLADLADYRIERQRRRAALDELARLSVELDEHDTDESVRTR
ncbi:MAG: helix-turn-helix domain-containing protein [Propionibacteriaceae bacterium]|jgi:excisionase family DNA binding protein|nr:helix-turn-helix domain-containing protein [Propionibacteriaceae bacterium]